MQYFSQVGVPWGIALSHTGLGAASAGLQNYTQARYHYQQSVQISASSNRVEDTLTLILHFAQLLAKQGNKQHAFHLIAFVVAQPVAWEIDRLDAEHLRRQLQAELSPEVYTEGQAQGQALELDAILRELMAEP